MDSVSSGPERQQMMKQNCRSCPTSFVWTGKLIMNRLMSYTEYSTYTLVFLIKNVPAVYLVLSTMSFKQSNAVS